MGRREYGLKIGSSTGYTSEMVTTGRPSPAMIYLNMVNMDVYPAQAVLKVDDTTSGIVAGLVAGCWTVGIAKTGNYVAMTEEEMDKADPAELKEKVEKAKSILYKNGAHFVIETTRDLPGVVEEINRRMAMGIRP